MTRAGFRLAAAALATAAGSIGLLAGAGPAAAAQCASMTVQYADVPPAIDITPARVSIPWQGCVMFTNQTATTATITVATGYRVTLGFGESTTARTNYVGTTAGLHKVTATSGPADADGSITVGASPTPTPSTTPATSRHSSSAAAGSPTGSGGSPTGPQVAPTPAHARRHVAPARRPRPAVTPTPPAASMPAPVDVGPPPGSTSATRVVAGPIEPPSGRALGLPAALAALAVAGTAAAFVRVLLAEPVAAVDDRATVGGTA